MALSITDLSDVSNTREFVPSPKWNDADEAALLYDESMKPVVTHSRGVGDGEGVGDADGAGVAAMGLGAMVGAGTGCAKTGTAQRPQAAKRAAAKSFNPPPKERLLR
jgi:hypothetical protein